MGHVDKILAHRITKPKTRYYNDFFTIEVCENFHIHWRNMRIQMTDKEFEVFSKAMMNSYRKWELMKKPYPYHETIYLQPAWDNLPDEQVFKNEIKIERQTSNMNLPEVHVHYKNLRIDLDMSELKELKEMFNSISMDEFEEKVVIDEKEIQ